MAAIPWPLAAFAALLGGSTMAESDKIQAFLTLANLLAPSGKEQRGFNALVRNVQRDFSGETEPKRELYIMQHLVGRLYDGIAYGNWPEA
jgi:hypothetical protein